MSTVQLAVRAPAVRKQTNVAVITRLVVCKLWDTFCKMWHTVYHPKRGPKTTNVSIKPCEYIHYNSVNNIFLKQKDVTMSAFIKCHMETIYHKTVWQQPVKTQNRSILTLAPGTSHASLLKHEQTDVERQSHMNLQHF